MAVRDSDSAEVTIHAGYFTIADDLQGGDSRTWVYTVLQSIRATIAGTASREESSYSIGGRALSVRTVSELLELERDFAKRWKQEQDDLKRAAGKTVSSRVLISMRA